MSRVTKAQSFNAAQWASKHWRPLSFFLLLLLLSFTPLRFISLLLVIYMGGKFLPLKLGLIARCVVSFLLLSCCLCIVGALAWMFGIALSSSLVLMVALVGIFGWWAKCDFKPSLKPKTSELLDYSDLSALAMTIIAVAIVLWPLKDNFRFSTLASIIMTGGDNSAHLEMFKVNDLNRGFAIGGSNRVDMPRNNISYPQGWHLNGAYLKWTAEVVRPIGTSPIKILTFYYAVAVLWFALMIFMIIRLSSYLLFSIFPRAPSFLSLPVSLFAGAGIGAWLFSLFEYGFQSHIGALAILLVELLLLAEAYRFEPQDRYKYFLGAMLAVAGVTMFWSFLLPVAFALVAICTLQTVIANKKLPDWSVLAWFVFLSWMVLFQPIMQSVFVIKTTVSEPIITMRGNIVQSSMYPLVMTFLVICAYVYFRFKSKALKVFWLAAFIALGFSLVLMYHQLQTVQELRYYYFKANFTYIVLAIIVLAAMAGDFSRQLLAHSPIKNLRLHTLIVGSIICAFGVVGMVGNRASAVDDFLKNRMGGVSAPQAEAISNVMSSDPNVGLSLIPIGSCNRGNDIRGAQLAHALIYNNRTNDPSVYQYLELSYLDKNYLFGAIKNYIQTYDHITIVSSDLALSGELKEFLGPLQNKAMIVEADSSIETEPVSQCPDRVRILTEQERASGIQ